MIKQQPRFVFYPAEIRFHCIYVAVHLIMLLYTAYQYTIAHPPETLQTSYLTPILNLKRDAHDNQWESYRSNLCLLIFLILIWKVVGRFIEKYENEKIWIFGVLMVLFSFRGDAVFYLCIIISWYYYTVYFINKPYFIIACWIIMLVTLYLNQLSNHFEFASNFMQQYIPFEWFKNSSRLIHCSQLLNMTFLKLLSFAIDQKRGNESEDKIKHQAKCSDCKADNQCLKERNYFYPSNYSFKSYINYILFIPTLLTGPPISYNNYHSFQQRPIRTIPSFTHTLLLVITFQLYQHLFPVTPIHHSQSLLEAEIFTLLHLVFIWYKFLVIWKIGRAWCQFYGVDVVDNMSRCVCNNYGFEGFWRMWHKGFNQWLVRYLYIPLGGNQSAFPTIVVIAFVAFWHDHTVNIVLWALTFVLFILPQIYIKKYFRNKHPQLYRMQWFKYLAAFVSSLYIYLLAFSNIIGFGYGIDKASILFEKLQNQWISLVWSIITLMSACILMFYQRDQQIDKNKQE